MEDQTLKGRRRTYLRFDGVRWEFVISDMTEDGSIDTFNCKECDLFLPIGKFVNYQGIKKEIPDNFLQCACGPVLIIS